MRLGFFAQQNQQALALATINPAALTNHFANDDESVLEDDYSPTDESPTDENLDSLNKLQKKFRDKSNLFDLDLKYWEKVKLLILTQEKVDELEETLSHKTFLQKIYQILEKIKTFFESPDYYLRQLFMRTKPRMSALCNKLDKLTAALDKNENQSISEVRKLKVEICNTNIAILNAFQAMINQINREIDYCVRFINLTETITTNIIRFTVGFKIPLPQLDLGLGMHYRMSLYNMIHSPLEKIYHFMLDSQGAIERSRRKAVPSCDPHLFSSTKEAPTGLKRINSSPNFLAISGVKKDVRQPNTRHFECGREKSYSR